MTTETSIQITVKKPELFKRHYEFWLGEQARAVLDYGKGWFNNAVIDIGGRRWTIKTSGLWKKILELKAEQSPFIRLELPVTWNYKLSVSLDNRQTWHFKPTGFWKGAWAWYDDREQMVVEIRSNQFSKKNRGQVTLHQPASSDLLLLMALGWYMVVAYEDDSNAG